VIAHRGEHGAGYDDRHGAAGTAGTTATAARGVRGTLWSVPSVAVAFLASQHHALHMLLLTVGVGGAGASFLTMFPTVRRLMLLLSLVMVGVTLYQHWRHWPPLAVRALGLVSAALTFGLLVWLIGTYGW
jgi:hypothetical protein